MGRGDSGMRNPDNSLMLLQVVQDVHSWKPLFAFGLPETSILSPRGQLGTRTTRYWVRNRAPHWRANASISRHPYRSSAIPAEAAHARESKPAALPTARSGFGSVVVPRRGGRQGPSHARGWSGRRRRAAGMTKMPTTAAASMPPATAVPTARRDSSAAPSARHQRDQAGDEGEARHHHRAEAGCAPVDRAASTIDAPSSRLTLANSTIRIAFLAASAMQHDEADLGVDVEREAGEP